jgi:hypothetical protein
MVGIEPTTDGLRNRCSTAELHWLAVEAINLQEAIVDNLGQAGANGKPIPAASGVRAMKNVSDPQRSVNDSG